MRQLRGRLVFFEAHLDQFRGSYCLLLPPVAEQNRGSGSILEKQPLEEGLRHGC
jgi:hypothetical protein